MLRRFSWYWTKMFQFADLSILIGAWFATKVWLTPGIELNFFEHLSSLSLLVIGWASIAQLLSLYQSRRLITALEELKVLALIVMIFCLFVNAVVTLGILHHPDPILFGTSFWVGVTGFHCAVRIVLRYLRINGFNLRRVLIYGANQIGQRTANNLIRRPQAGMKVVGFLDDNPELQDTTMNCRGRAVPILGTSQEVRQLIDEQDIQYVIIALPSSAHERMKEFIREIGDLPVNVSVVPDLFDVISIQAHSENISDIPMIGVRQPCIDSHEAVIKRMIDLITSVFSLLICGPLMLLIAAWIKLDSKGPVLFTQERIGLNGKPFKMYKFRTMVVDAEKRLDELIKVDELNQPVFKIEDDPRVTRVGRILRKTSLDELPQFFNVLWGDMSLVGPRPEEVRIVKMYSYEQRQRLAVKPGITGPMQVNGRGDLAFDERLGLEINYIKNYSLYRDIELLVQTVPAVLLGKGAH